jgi:hypothetical protein
MWNSVQSYRKQTTCIHALREEKDAPATIRHSKGAGSPHYRRRLEIGEILIKVGEEHEKIDSMHSYAMPCYGYFVREL